MNILRNLEAVVIVALALTFVTAFANAAPVTAPAVKAAPAAEANIATVVVSAKRPTVAQKMKARD